MNYRALGRNINQVFLSLALFIVFCVCCESTLYSKEQPAEVPESILVEAQEISDSVMSPYCPGRTLSACPSSDALTLRNRIVSMLLEGYSPDAVKRQVYASFGDEVRGAPRAQGFGIVAWSMPVVICLLGVSLIWVYLLNSKKSVLSDSDMRFKDAESEVKDILNHNLRSK